MDECPDIERLVESLTNIKKFAEENAIFLLTSQPHIKVARLQPIELDLLKKPYQRLIYRDVKLYVEDAVKDNENLTNSKRNIKSALLDKKERYSHSVTFFIIVRK
jgi:hypothetical protein